MVIKAALGILFILASTVVMGEQYKLDSAHSNLGFKVRHLGISNVRGSFQKFEGTGSYDPKTNKINDIKVKISADSIDTNEPDRDKHLRSDDFFDVAKHPYITFETSKVEYNGNKPTKLVGDLTLRGVKKTITLEVEEWGGVAEDPWGNKKLAFEASGEIDRREYGLTWNKGLKKVGGLTVGNEVKLILEVQGLKVK